MFNYKIKGATKGDIYGIVLENRFLTEKQAEDLINPEKEGVKEHDPFLFKNMKMGVLQLRESIRFKKKIGIVVDPDVDGYSATAMLHDFIINKIGYKNCEVLFHKKNVKSHGVDTDVVNQTIKNQIDFLILPDAGSSESDFKEMQKLFKKGIKVLVIDHHGVEYDYDITKGEDITMINYNQKGCEYPNKYLSGCAVTYKFITACSSLLSIPYRNNEYIDLVALTLVSDMMNLRDSLENRLLLKIGSDKKNIQNLFINSFIEEKKLVGDKLSFVDYAFNIAPLINGTIRTGSQKDKEMLFKAFFEDVQVESGKRGCKGQLAPIQTEIIRIMGNNKNRQDKKIKDVKPNITEIVKKDDNKVVFIDIGDMVDSSMTGVLANKVLYDTVKRPLFLYREKAGEECTVGGSARGYKVDSLKDLCKETGLFNFVSGHDNAHGFEMPKDNIEEAIKALNEKLKDIDFTDFLEVDRVYEKAVNYNDVKKIADKSDLFCKEIPEPIFLVKNVKLHTNDIRPINNCTYGFKIGDVSFTKNFGSKVWYQSATLLDQLDFGGDIVADIEVKFRKNTKGFYYCEIGEMHSRIDLKEDEIDF